MVKIMSILKKVNLFLLASVVMLTPQGASAMGSDSDDLEGNKTPILYPNSSEVLSEDEKTTAGTFSSDAGDLEAQKKAAGKRKDDFDKISGNLSPIGAALKSFENPKTSPRKKEKYKGGMGSSESFEISSPSTNMETETPQQFEDRLPDRLREFEKRFNVVRQNISSDKVEKLKTFNQLYSSFEDVVAIYRTYYPDFQIVPEHELRRHYIKRRSSRNLVTNQSLDGKKLTQDPHGDSPRLLRDSGRSSIKLELESSPLFRERRTEEELHSSSDNFSPVSPRFTEESSSSPQPLPVPMPSSSPSLQCRQTISGGLPVRLKNGNSSLSLIPLSSHLQSSSGNLSSSSQSPLSPRLMSGSSVPSIHYVSPEESSSILKSPPVTPRRTEGSSSLRPLPGAPLSSPPPPPRRRTITGSSSPSRPLPQRPLLRTLPSFDSPAEMQETPPSSPLSQVLSSSAEEIHRSLSGSPSSLRRRMATYHTKPLILPEIETGFPEDTSDKSDILLPLEVPDR